MARASDGQQGRSDQDLLEAVRSGDSAAAGEIFTLHHPSALRVANSLVDATSAEDVAAEAMEKLLRAVQKGAGPTEAIRPYLIQIVRNTASDLYRRRRETPTDFDDHSLPHISDSSDSINDSILVRAAFERLPERWQAVLWLTSVEDVDRDQIGQQLGIRPGAVSQLAVRAREGLRQAYLAEYSQVGDPSCKGVFDRLPAYVRARTKSEEGARISAHLDNCSSCSRIAGNLRGLNRGLGATLAVAIVGTTAAASLVKTSTVAAAAVPLWRRGSAQNAVIGAVLVGGLLATAAVAAGINANNQQDSAAQAAAAPAIPGQSAPSGGANPSGSLPTATAAASATPTTNAYPTQPSVAESGDPSTPAKPAPAPTKTTPKPTPTPTPGNSSSTPAPSPPVADSFTLGDPLVTASGNGSYAAKLTIPITSTRVATTLTAALWFSGVTGHQLIGSSWTCTSSSGGSLGGTAMECTTTTTQTDADLVMHLDTTLPEDLLVTVRSSASPAEVHSAQRTLKL